MSSDSSEKTQPKKTKRSWLKVSAKHDLGPPWLVILTILVIFLASQVAAAFIVDLVMGALRHSSSISLNDSPTSEFFYVLLAEGIAALLAIYGVKKRSLGLGFIGLGRKPNRSDLGRALVGFGVFYLALIVISGILTIFFPDLNNGSQNVGFNDLSTRADTVLAFVALVFFPPLGEETLVRGYLYSGLRKRMRFLPALLITSVLFGLAHLPTGASPGPLWAAGLNTFILSVVLVYLRESSGALYAGMIVHMLNNLIAFGFHFHL